MKAQLFFKQFGLGVSFAAIIALSATLILSLLSLLTYLFLPFNAIVVYVLGIIMSFIISFFIRRFFFKGNKYFLIDEINNDKKNNIWIKAISEKKYLKKKTVVLSYIPLIVLGILFIVAIVFLNPILSQNVDDLFSYFWHTALGSLLSGMPMALIMFIFFEIKTLSVCNKCDAVNAFIYDEELDFTSSSAFTGNSYNAPIAHHGMSWGGGGYDTKKLESFSNQIVCHCACCEEKTVLSELPEDSKVVTDK